MTATAADERRTLTQQRHAQVGQAIRGLRPDLVAYVPSMSIAPIILDVEGAEESRVLADGGRLRVFPVSREEEAVGIIGALPLAGKFGVILMQDNGFGNALTALTTFAESYHLPLLIVANTRGGLGEYNSMIHSISAAVPSMLAAARIPVFRLDRTHTPTGWGATVAEAGKHARMTHRPVVVLMEFFDVPGEGSLA
jgi:sulfopyruvate decarboxylase subunit alpha